MKISKLLTVACLSTTAIVPATTASAFFPFCPPRIETCYCTFIYPCPIIDPVTVGTTHFNKKTLEDIEETIKKNNEILLKQASSLGKSATPQGILGFDVLSFDLDKLVQGQLDDITATIENLQKKVQDIALSGNELANMLKDGIDPQRIASAFNEAGLSITELQGAGLGDDVINGILNGDLNKDQLLSSIKSLDMKKTLLESAQIDRSAIEDVINGAMSFEDLEAQIKDVANLDINDLKQAGIDIGSLKSVAGSGDLSFVDGVAREIGLGSSVDLKNPLAGLGIDSAKIQAVARGEISPREIGSILQSQGIDPRAIILPTPSGTPVNGLGEIVKDATNRIDLATKDFDGLQAALDTYVPDIRTSADSVLSNLSAAAGIDMKSNEFMDHLVSGRIRSDDMLDLFSSQGIGPDQFSQAGISHDTIKSLQKGQFDGRQLLEFSRNMGIGSQALDSLGLGKNDLKAVARGELKPDEFMSRARKAGLDDNLLKKIGLDPKRIEGLAKSSSQKEAENIAEQAGGAPASSLQIPQQAPSQPAGEAISQPTNGMPHEQAAPSTPVSGSAPTPASIGESCATQMPLLTSQEPPNHFGGNVAAIDRSISPGNLDLWRMSIPGIKSLANSDKAHILARSIQVKTVLNDALDALDAFAEEIQGSSSREEDLFVNYAIKTQVLMAKAEVTSLIGYLASIKAASHVNEDTLNPVPTLPHDAGWMDRAQKAADAEAAADAEDAAKLNEAARAYSDLKYRTERLIEGHDNLVIAKDLEDALPLLEAGVMRHEAAKRHKYGLEQMVRSTAARLYSGNQAATDALLADLNRAAMSNAGEDRWRDSYSAATSLEHEALDSGGRYASMAGANRVSKPSPLPYAYSSVDSDSEHDPYRIITPPRKRDEDGDRPPIPPLRGLFQYYMESVRREADYGASRRGPVSSTMSQKAWDEFQNNAPHCLSGPIPSTPENLASRPDLFDMSPSCDHLVYSGGDSEDYIDASNLGGTDALIWTSKIDIDLAKQETRGEKNLIKSIDGLISDPETQTKVKIIEADGQPSWAKEIKVNISVLQKILADPSFTKFASDM